jgi:hypothetical protein
MLLDLFLRGRDSKSTAGEAFTPLDLFHRGRNLVVIWGIRGSVHMFSANATLEPVAAERLGEWGAAEGVFSLGVAESCSICVLLLWKGMWTK